MEQLLQYLASEKPGRVRSSAKLEALLADCWHEFEGSVGEGMHGGKLKGRTEDVRWNPPVLSFQIERHGGTVLGSTRADRHVWTIDLDKKTATCEKVGQRQLEPMRAKLDVGPMAQEVAQSIIDHKEDERLLWGKDGTVRIVTGKILPSGSAFKQTLTGRRKRFLTAVDETLSSAGWRRVRTGVYAPPLELKLVK